jgi:adenylate cyclase
VDADRKAWEAAGLYQPDAPEADERRALLEYLTARGATMEQMVEAHRTGSLPAVAGDLVLGTRAATVSVQEMADRSGVPVERVQRVLLANGLPATPDSHVPLGLAVLMGSFEQGAAILGDESILAFSRALGAAATNIAEAAVALFYSELGPGTEREGATELARAQVAETATLAFATVPEVLSQVLLAQFDRATRRASMSREWSATAGAGAASPPTPGAGELVALGFVDLVGSTAWAEALDLREQSLALSRFESAAWTSAVLAGGRVVKMIGDEVFFAAPTPAAAARIGVEVLRAVALDPVLPPARGAVGFGLVAPREGDYFGPLVNLVARLVKVAAPGSLAVTEEVAAALSPEEWAVTDLGPQPVRGLERPVRAFTVSPTGVAGQS